VVVVAVVVVAVSIVEAGAPDSDEASGRSWISI
jgi:hypothetical protein